MFKVGNYSKIYYNELVSNHVYMGASLPYLNKELDTLLFGRRNNVCLFKLDEIVFSMRNVLCSIIMFSRCRSHFWMHNPKIFVLNNLLNDKLLKFLNLSIIDLQFWIPGLLTNSNVYRNYKKTCGGSLKLPLNVIFFNAFKSKLTINEAFRKNLVVTGIVDSDIMRKEVCKVTYGVFGNDDSYGSIQFYLYFFMYAIFIGKISERKILFSSYEKFILSKNKNKKMVSYSKLFTTLCLLRELNSYPPKRNRF